MESSRWLHALLFALSVLLIGINTYVFTHRTLLAGLFAMLLFLSSADMITLHSQAWSESSFLVFALSAFLFVALYVVNAQPGLLLAASVFLALAMTTRYVGITLLPPMLLVIFACARKPISARLKDCLILSVVGMLPLVLWLVRNVVVAGTATSRTFVFHPIDGSHITQLVRTLYDFWFPIRATIYTKGFQFLVASVSLLVGFLAVLRASLRGTQPLSASLIMQLLVLLFSISYICFLFVSISIADAHTPLNARIMAPLYGLGIIFVVCLAWSVSQLKGCSSLWWAFLLFLLVPIGINVDRAASTVSSRHKNGLGYTSRSWRQSETITYVKALPKESVLYSNVPNAIRFLTGKQARWIPRLFHPGTKLSNPTFRQQMHAMYNNLLLHNAQLIYFNRTGRKYVPTRKRLERTYHFPVLHRLKDGTVYGVRFPDTPAESGPKPDTDGRERLRGQSRRKKPGSVWKEGG